MIPLLYWHETVRRLLTTYEITHRLRVADVQPRVILLIIRTQYLWNFNLLKLDCKCSFAFDCYCNWIYNEFNNSENFNNQISVKIVPVLEKPWMLSRKKKIDIQVCTILDLQIICNNILCKHIPLLTAISHYLPLYNLFYIQ